MQEAFLHYIWQYQYFDKRDLKTVQGEDLQVIRPGLLNTNAGPDFGNAKIKLGPMSWAGSVEVHILSSEWNAHHHDQDEAYDNVILHVVWEDDKPVVRGDGSVVPAIELRARVTPDLVHQYRKLLNSGSTIPCAQMLPSVPELIRNNMLDRATIERLETKAAEIDRLLITNNGDWEETAYQLLARNFGFKVNADPFLQLAKGLPFKLLQKHADKPLQVEAMLFGVAGFLSGKTQFDYHKQLRREYDLLRNKYQLHKSEMSASQWKFLRLRPANFPSLRLAQFAALIVKQKNLFSKIISETDLRAINDWFEAPQSDFWNTHYTFRKRVSPHISSIGESSVENIVINTIVPFLVSYGKYKDEALFVERAELLLKQLKSEVNKITTNWIDAGWEVKNAFDSQALIQLFNSYCVPRQCLNCLIGAALLKPGECSSGSQR